MKRCTAWLAVAGLATLMASCATQSSLPVADPPGFWRGLFDGLVIFFSLIASIFTDIRIYAYPNAGGWYDFGYVLGVSAALGGSATARAGSGKKRKPRGNGGGNDVSGQPGSH